MLSIKRKEIEGTVFIIVVFSDAVSVGQIGDMSEFVSENSQSGKAVLVAIDEGFHFSFKKLGAAISVAKNLLNAPLLGLYNEATDRLKRFFSEVGKSQMKYPMYTFESREQIWKILTLRYSENCVTELQKLLDSSPVIVITD